MKNNIKIKILFMFLVSVVTIIASLLYYNYQNKKILEQKQIDTYRQDSAKMFQYIIKDIEQKYKSYIKNAFETKDIIEAIKNDDKQALLNKTLEKFNILNELLNTNHKIHFYNNKNEPIIELSNSMRKVNTNFASHPIINATNEYVSMKSGIEIEKDGVYYQVVVPIVDKFEHLGSIEIAVDAKYLVNLLEKYLNVSSLILINDKYLTTLEDKSKILKSFKYYGIIYKNRLCPELEKLIDLEDNINLISKNDKKYLINTNLELKDYHNQIVGKVVVAYDITELVSQNSMLFINTILVISLVVIALFALFNFLLDILIKNIKTKQDDVLRQKQLLFSIINSVDDIIFYKNKEFKYEIVNKAFEKLVNKSNNEIVGKSDNEIFDKDIAEAFKMVDEETLYNSSYNTNYHVLKHQNGKNIHLLSSKYPLKDAQGSIIGIVGSSKDITSYKLIEENLIKAQEELKQHHKDLEVKIFEQNREIQSSKDKLLLINKELSKQLKIVDDNVIMVTTDTTGKILNVSKAYLNLTGYPKLEILKCGFSVLRDKDIDSKVYKQMWYTIKSGKIWQGEIKNRDAQNNIFWLDMQIFPIFDDDDGEIVKFKAISNNITDKKIIQELAITDELTTLFNRRYFNQRLEQLMKKAQNSDLYFTFMMFDIDHFKLYNDTYGHQAGDVALSRVALSLKESTNIKDLFRLGGEEFGLLAVSLDENEAKKLANDIKDNIKNMNIKHIHNLPHEVVTVSLGLFVAKGSQIKSLNDVYKDCDELLYKAKRNGRNNICTNIY